MNAYSEYADNDGQGYQSRLLRVEDEAQSLLDAIVADVRAGNAGRHYQAKEDFKRDVSTVNAYVTLTVPHDALTREIDHLYRNYTTQTFRDPNRKEFTIGVAVTVQSENILRWMEEHDIDTSDVFNQRLEGDALDSWYIQHVATGVAYAGLMRGR